mgnify:CR=1 FL=1
MIEITYRDAKDIDLDEMCRLRADAGFHRLSHDALREHFDGSRWVLSAWDGERLVGFVRAISDGVSLAYVSSMMVDSAYRRRGIARELMRRLTADRPTVRFVLHAREEAMAFYRAIGFADRSQMMSIERERAE